MSLRDAAGGGPRLIAAWWLRWERRHRHAAATHVVAENTLGHEMRLLSRRVRVVAGIGYEPATEGPVDTAAIARRLAVRARDLLGRGRTVRRWSAAAAEAAAPADHEVRP